MFEKTYSLLNRKNKIGLLKVFTFLFLAIIFEFIGLGLFYPFLNLIQGNELKQNSFFYPFLIKIDSSSIFYFGGFLFIIFLIKNIILSLVSYFQNRELYNISASLADNLYSKYLDQHYLFFNKRKTSDLIKIIQIEIPAFGAFCFNVINLIIEGFIMISIVCIVIMTEPVGSLLMALYFLIFSLIFYFSTKKILIKYGNIRENLDRDLSSLTLNSLNAITELKILERIDFFTNRFKYLIFGKASIYAKNNFLSQLPRYYLEIVTFGGILFYLAYFHLNENITQEIISFLGFFVVATIRLIPSLNKFLNSFQAIKFNSSSINSIYNEFKYLKENINSKMDVNLIPIKKFESLHLKNVSFSYDEKFILKNINLYINKGDTLAIVGNSGAGKSTLLNIITGLIQPNSGEILVNNLSLKKFNYRKLIGYIPQKPFFINDTIINNITIGLEQNQIDHSRVKEVLKIAELNKLINELPEGMFTNIGENGGKISGGQSQRLAIARALYNKPEILIFDESTSALDNLTEAKVIDNIFKLKKTLIFITHKKDYLERFDKTLKLN